MNRADKGREVARARELLRAWLPEGSAVWTLNVHRASRSYSVVPIIVVDGFGDAPRGPGGSLLELRDVSAWVAPAIGRPFDDRHGGVRMPTGGLDVGQLLVRSLGQSLYGYNGAASLTHRRL